jgi:hypothetical protein
VGQSIPPTDYFDDDVMLSVEPPTESRPSIRLRAAGTGVGALVELSATGASRLAGMLESAVVTAIHRGLGGGAR